MQLGDLHGATCVKEWVADGKAGDTELQDGEPGRLERGKGWEVETSSPQK